MSPVAPTAASSPLPGDAIRLSVIIVNWNTRDLLAACLRSLEQHQPPATEIIVVDNGSTDGSPAMVAQDFHRVRLLALDENVGFSRGNNAGIDIALGAYILLLNSDTEVRPKALEIMSDYLDNHPDVGAVGPKLVSPDGTVQESCRSFPSHRTALFNRKSLLTRLFPNNRFSRQYLLSDEERARTREVDWIMGAALMTRRTVIDQVGPLDPEFFMYAEDVDWCYRMHKAGWKIVFVPEAEIMHHYEKSARAVPFKMLRERHRSMWLFYRKHYSRGIIMGAVTFAGIGLRLATLTMVETLRKLVKKNE